MKKISVIMLFVFGLIAFSGCDGDLEDGDGYKFLFFSGPKEVSAEQQDIVCKPSDDVEFTLACVYYSIYQETGNSLLTDIVEQETVYFSSGESSCVRDWFLVEVVDGNLHVLVSENSTPYYRCINIQVDPEDIDMISGSYQVIQTPVESSLPE